MNTDEKAVDLQVQASCTTWLETAAAQEKGTTKKCVLARLVSEVIAERQAQL